MALVVGLSWLAIYLAGVRDLSASIVPDRAAAAARTRLLSGSSALTWRLTRAVMAGWAVSITVGALMMGLVAKSVGGELSADTGDRSEFARLGFRGSGAAQYLAITFLVVALLVSFMACSQVAAVRREEEAGRIDHLLVRPMSRNRWLGGRVLVTVGCVLTGGVLAGLAAWLGAASQSSGLRIGTLMNAGLNTVPAAIVVLGAGILAFGVRPRATSAVMYGLLAWSFLVEIIGGIINASHWFLDTSLLHQMSAAPAVNPNWTSGSIMVVVGLVGVGAGTCAFRRRDLAGE